MNFPSHKGIRFTSLSWREVVFVLILCVSAFFLRSYALYRDLIFAFDQGRDALQMQKISNGDLTLIGPVTGLSGVFLGPFWYYFLFPWYVVGNGNPAIAGTAMVFFHAVAVGLVYFVGKQFAGKIAGATAAVLFTFSFSNIMFARWLSNPTPLPLFALTAFTLLYFAFQKKSKILFAVSGLIFGLCMQLEAANAVWFFPTVALILLIEVLRDWKRAKKNTKNPVIFQMLLHGILFAIGVGVTLLPQIAFELKSGFLLTKNVITAFGASQKIPLMNSLPRRIPLLFTLYARGLFVQQTALFGVLAGIVAFLGVRLFPKLWENRGIRIVLLWFFVPFFFHTIYTGNYGNFWDYYVISQHLALYLLIGCIFAFAIHTYSKMRSLLTILLGAIVLLSVGINLMKWQEIIKPYEERFALSMQVDATNWIIDTAGGTPYGVWVYTPDAQDQAHRYVFSWVGKQRKTFPMEHVEQAPLIYLVVEDDPGFAKRRSEWIANNMKFGELIDQKKFGAITVYKLRNTFQPLK